MRLGIIGLPQSGKTTIFNALTGQNLPTGFGTGGQLEVHTAVVGVPDSRVDFLSGLYNPKKTVYATVTYKDIGGLDTGIGEGGLSGPLRNELQQVDGFVHVVRAFANEDVAHPQGSVDPQRDLESLEGEFLLLDLIAVERRLERLKEEWGKKTENRRQNELETELMGRLQAQLEAEKPLRALDLTPDELKLVRGYGLMTLKPLLVVLNTGEDVPAPESSGQLRSAGHGAGQPAGEHRGRDRPASVRRSGRLPGRVRDYRAGRAARDPAELRPAGHPVLLHRGGG